MMPQTPPAGRPSPSRQMGNFVRVALVIIMAAAVARAAGAQAAAPTSSQVPAAVQNATVERVTASFLLALGAMPTVEDAARWAEEPAPLAELLARHRRQLEDDTARTLVLVAKARLDAFGETGGTTPTADELSGGLYVERVRRHLRWLTEHPADYTQVLHRAYSLVLRRDAYPLEIDYWNKRAPLPFALVAACVDDWARRNQPGLTVTSGVPAVSVNSGYLVAVRLSPPVAAEARAAVGLRPVTRTATGRHVIGPGADEVTSVGGIHFAAAGAGPQAPFAARQ